MACLKHQWLFLNTLDSVDKIRKLVSFYVSEHNERLPHSAFRGQTPERDVLRERGGRPATIDAGKRTARAKRLETNRAKACAACAGAVEESEAA